MAVKKRSSGSSPESEGSQEKKQESVRVTLSQGESELIGRLAALWKRSKSDIVLDGYRRSVPALVESYEAWQRIHCQPSQDEPIGSQGENEE